MPSKKTLVTGASEGIGRAFAKQLANEGYAVTAVARNEERLKNLMEEIGTNHCFIVADLSTDKGVKTVTEELRKDHYTLLVNNAGFGVYGKFPGPSLERIQEMTRLNCDAVVALSCAFLSQAKSGDALINVSSIGAFLPMPLSGVYAATKAFVTSFSESLWFEQKDKGIYVLGLCPGVTTTQFHSRAGGKDSEVPASLTQTPEDVVEVAMSALKNRAKPTIVTGAKNKMLTTLSKLMPRKTVVNISGWVRNRVSPYN